MFRKQKITHRSHIMQQVNIHTKTYALMG